MGAILHRYDTVHMSSSVQLIKSERLFSFRDESRFLFIRKFTVKLSSSLMSATRYLFEYIKKKRFIFF